MGNKQSKSAANPCLLSQWQCKECNALNEMTDSQCKSCFVDTEQLSALDQIMHEQDLLFNGYFRTKILNTLSRNFESKLMTDDIIDLCHIFYCVDLKSHMDEHKDLYEAKTNEWSNIIPDSREQAERYILHKIANQLTVDQQFFMAYEIRELLITVSTNPGLKARNLVCMAYLLQHWDIKRFERERSYGEIADSVE